MEDKKKFTLVKVYHKPYRLFRDPYVVNVGNLNSARPDADSRAWLESSMDFCCASSSRFDMMNSEWPTYQRLLHNLEFCAGREGQLVSLQHYSKVMDLNTLRDEPWRDTTQMEDARGQMCTDAKSMDEFGYGDVETAMRGCSVVVGNQYPCSVVQSMSANLAVETKDAVMEFATIAENFASEQFAGSVYTADRFIEYVNSKIQYWRGGPVICTLEEMRSLLDYTIAFQHAFLDSKRWLSQEIFKNKDLRGVGYVGEMVMGFALHCLVESKRAAGEKVGFCQMHTDAAVTYGVCKK